MLLGDRCVEILVTSAEVGAIHLSSTCGDDWLHSANAFGPDMLSAETFGCRETDDHVLSVHICVLDPLLGSDCIVSHVSISDNRRCEPDGVTDEGSRSIISPYFKTIGKLGCTSPSEKSPEYTC